MDYNHTPSAYRLTTSNNNYTHQAGLVAPGNRMSSAAIPAWAAMSEVPFVWVVGLWTEWREDLFFAIGGTVLLLACVVLALKGDWLTFFKFSPTGTVERLHWLCTKIMLVWSFVALLVLVPLYVAGANEYECGADWLRTTLAYLADSPMSEWGVACMACVFAAGSAFTVVMIWRRAEGMQYAELASPSQSHLPWWKIAERATPSTLQLPWWKIAMIWSPVTMILSIPTAMFALSKSIPGDANSIGLSTAMLQGFQYSAGPLLSFINAVLVPTIARSITKKSNPHRATALILFARFTVTILVPFVILFIFGQDCHGLWLQLWTPCHDHPVNFDLAGQVPASGPESYLETGVCPANAYCTSAISIPLVTHKDICGEQEPAPGKCSRFVLEGLGGLMIAKLTITAFVSPAIMLILSFPSVRRLKEAGLRTLLCNPYYADVKSLDVEMASMVMMMDLGLIFGFAIPPVLPLLYIAFAAHLAVFHLAAERLGMQTKYEAKPATHYLVLSLLMGSALNVWFFVDNRDSIAGWTLVCIGVPLSVCVGFGIGATWHWLTRDQVSQAIPDVISPAEELNPYVAMA